MSRELKIKLFNFLKNLEESNPLWKRINYTKVKMFNDVNSLWIRTPLEEKAGFLYKKILDTSRLVDDTLLEGKAILQIIKKAMKEGKQ